jgi:uncharacterized protein YecE (DUF72 family)
VAKSAKPSADIIRFGTSSFSSKDWVGNFYPEGTQPGDFLRLYAKEFNTVEVDSTYYAIPSASTVDCWVDKTPEDFLISAKFPRSIVHAGEGAKPDAEAVLVPDKTYKERDIFLKVMDRLGSRRGPLVLQFPYFSREHFPSSKTFMERLDRFLGDLPKGYRYGVEIRNKNWLKSGFADLCREQNVALVLVDQAWMPLADELEKQFDPITTDFVYIRLLGDRKQIEAITETWDREVIDRQANLERWANYLAMLIERQIRTLVYVNNHYAGHAPTTVRRLQGMVS